MNEWSTYRGLVQVPPPQGHGMYLRWTHQQEKDSNLLAPPWLMKVAFCLDGRRSIFMSDYCSMSVIGTKIGWPLCKATTNVTISLSLYSNKSMTHGQRPPGQSPPKTEEHSDSRRLSGFHLWVLRLWISPLLDWRYLLIWSRSLRLTLGWVESRNWRSWM